MNQANEQDVPCCDWKEKYIALEKRMARMQIEMQDLKSQIKKDKGKVRSHFQHFYKKEAVEKEEIKGLKEKVEVLSNVIIRMEGQLQDANDKILNMQARSMRKNLIVSGIEEPKHETSEQLLNAVERFIAEKLQVQQNVPLKVVHRLNYVDGSEYRPVIIKLADINHKQLLLSKGPNLKGLKNDKDRYYYLNEQLPDQLAEDRRYAQQWIKENRSKPVDNQLQMKIHKNRLRINNEPYVKKVKPPKAAEILRLDPDDLATTKNASTIYGDSKLHEGSEFISYAAKITTVEQVRVAYRKLRIKYADATHISSAFRLDPPNGPFNQEGVDDGEHASGRCLLGLLQEHKVVNVAIFMVRFYGGKHIGGARFDITRNLAMKALQKIGAVQIVISPKPPRRQTRSMSVRGRGSQSRTNGFSATGASLNNNCDQSRVRPTPNTSPTVSPSQLYQANSCIPQDSESIQSSDETDEFLEIESQEEDYIAHPTESDTNCTDDGDGEA